LPRWLTRTPKTDARQAWFEQVASRAMPPDQDSYFSFNSVGYFAGQSQQMMSKATEHAGDNFTALVTNGLKSNSVIWSCERLRVAVASEARFVFQTISAGGQAGQLHGAPSTRLDLLNNPWTGGKTGDLIARMILHRDFAGNAYVVRRDSGLRCLRPDWVVIVMGSDDQPGDPNDVDAEVIGYWYFPGGVFAGKEPTMFMPDEVAHYAPFPDPLANYRGMSWLNPVIAETAADSAATEHKLNFFRNGATMQTVVTVDKDMDEGAFTRFIRKMNALTQGVANAYKTVYVAGGVDVRVVGADLKQLDFKVTQGGGETRIAAAAGTPPILVGLSEGLSSGQYNIYGQAKRSFVDGAMRPEWRNMCGSLETLARPPRNSRLWYDDSDIAYLRDDQTDAAQIMQTKASTINTLITSGFEPDAAVEAVEAQDFDLLVGKHTGLYSVQLQPPQPNGPLDSNGGQPELDAATLARALTLLRETITVDPLAIEPAPAKEGEA
jgi:phage portal protein BeeE